MDDYLAKPTKFKQHEAMLARWRSGQIPPDEKKETVALGTHESVNECVDAEVLAELRELDSSFGLLSALITNFLNDVPTRLAGLQEALRQGDAGALALVAHELNGSSGNLGVWKMRQLSIELQAVGRNKNISKAGALFIQLVNEFELVRQRLVAEHATLTQDTLADDK
jgi:HPt (histidine-containing phosphotransfer) domain-containing protein